MTTYTEDEKRFLIQMEETYGSLDISIEEMIIKTHRETKRRDAAALLENGVDPDIVSKVTGVPEEY